MFKEVLGDLREIVALLKESSRSLAVLGATLTILEVALGIFGLYSIKLLIDHLSTGEFLGDNVAGNSDTWFYVVLVGVSLLCTVVVQAFGGLVRAEQGMRVGELVDWKVHSQSTSLDLSFYESPKYFDTLQRARQAGIHRPGSVVNSLLLGIKSAILLFGIFVMIASIEWRMLPVLFVVVCLVLFVRLKFTKRLFDWQYSVTQLERRARYLDWLLTSDLHAKELRIGGLGGFLKRTYGIARRDLNEQQLFIEKARTKAEIFVSVLGVVAFAGAIIFIVWETVENRQTVGNLVFFVLLFRRAETGGRELVGNISKLYDDRLYLRQLFAFLSLKPDIGSPPVHAHTSPTFLEELRFENVCFRYPGEERYALAEVNLSVRPRQIVGLVGENGSGKTSLVKLMARLYDPSDGRILLDGVDIREYDPIEYRKLFSIVFQDYARYASTVAENIWYGDVEQEFLTEKLADAARLAGAERFVGQLRNGLDTKLSRMFDDGQEISIGQWQRIALARAFFRRSRVLVMDEPTSSIDPNAEADLFENFTERIGERSALIISHRLSTIRLADVTYVLQDGRIIEAGSHEELIRTGGHYCSMFQRQGRLYEGLPKAVEAGDLK